MAYVRQNLTTDELETFMRHTQELKAYGDGIANYLQGVGNQSLNALAGLLQPTSLSSLGKPTWPEKLKKHRSYLGER